MRFIFIIKILIKSQIIICIENKSPSHYNNPNDQSHLQPPRDVHALAGHLGVIALLSHQLHRLYQLHERMFRKFGHSSTCRFASHRFFPHGRRFAHPSVYDKEALHHRERDRRCGYFLSRAFIFPFWPVQEHGIFTGGGPVQTPRRSLFERNGVQYGEKARRVAEDLCGDKNQLLGDPSWSHFGMHILRT